MFKDLPLQAGPVIAVGPGYWMLCFSIKRKREKEKHRQLVCVCVWWVQTCCVLITLVILCRYYGHACVPVKDFCVLFHVPGCLQGTLRKAGKHRTLNSGDANLLVNFAEKQIGLHNHKRSPHKGPSVLHNCTSPLFY